MTARTTAAVLLVTAVGFVVAGARFFLVGFGDEPVSEAYRSFESSIWIPDLAIAMPLLLAAGARSWMKRTLDHPSVPLCAGALLFLGVLDVSFSVRFSGAYPSTSEQLFVLSCGLYFILLGMFLIIASRRARAAAREGEPGSS